MILLHLRANFGKLHGELHLHKGMNLLCLPNEAGKSTWSAFLVAMFYGVDTSERANAQNQGLPAKERYRPWDGGELSGAIDLLWGGRRITIERATAGRVPMGAFRAYETDGGVPVPELTGENCGRILCGVERSVFERTAFIRQLGLTVTEDQALEKRLSSLVTTGEDGGKSFSELEKTLRERKNKIFGRAGRYPKNQAAAEKTRRTLTELHALQDEAMQLRAELDAAEGKQTELNATLARIEQARAAQRRQGLRELELALAKQEQLCARLEQTELPDEETLRPMQLRLDSAENELQTAKMEAAFSSTTVEQPAAPSYFEGLSAQEAAEKVKSDAEKYDALTEAKPPKRLLPILVCAALLLGAAGLYFVSLYAAIAAAAAGLLALGIGLLLCARKSARQREQAHQASLLLVRYGVTDSGALAALSERYAAQLAQYEEKRGAADKQKQQLDAAVSAAQEKVNALIAATARFAPDCRTVADCREAISAALRIHSQRATERRTLENQRAQLHSMRTLLGDAPVEAVDAQALSLDEAALSYALQKATTLAGALRTRLAENRGARGEKGDAVELTAELERLNEALAADERAGEAMDLALAVLQDADKTLRARFSPQITAEAGELLRGMTEGKYAKLLLEPSMRLSVREDEGTVMRPAAAMSCGTADQMYLALRLAMCRRLLPEDAPLILDDALINFDNARTAAALHILRGEAQTRQIILFTCRPLAE